MSDPVYFAQHSSLDTEPRRITCNVFMSVVEGMAGRAFCNAMHEQLVKTRRLVIGPTVFTVEDRK